MGARQGERGRARPLRTSVLPASNCGRQRRNSKLTRLAIIQRCSLADVVVVTVVIVAVASCCCKLLLLVFGLFSIVAAVAVGVDQNAMHLLSIAVGRLLSNFVNSPGRASINLCGCHNSLHISCSLCCRCRGSQDEPSRGKSS